MEKEKDYTVEDKNPPVDTKKLKENSKPVAVNILAPNSIKINGSLKSILTS